MQFLYDFFPIILFFIAYKLSDIYIATAVAIAAAFLQVGVFWIRHRRFQNMHLISLLLLVLFGGTTILLRNNTFIMWKPTIAYWVFALIFLGSHFIGEKTIIQRMLGQQEIDLPIDKYRRLSISWIVFFILTGFLNLYVAYSFPEATWVNFKLFGLLGLTFVFAVLQAIYLARYMGKAKSS